MMKNREEGDIVRRRKIVSIVSFIILILFTALASYYIGKPMLEFVSEPEKFRLWVDKYGILGRLAFLGMVVLQVIIALIPGEPLEIGAGYAFGTVEGTVLCLLGNLIGGLLIFFLVRTWGIRFVELFFSREKILSTRFLQNTKRLNGVIFIVFLLPGTPKDLLTYVVGLTNIKFSTFVILTSVARLPSIITSTVSGGALGTKDYITAIIALSITCIISGFGVIMYKLINKNRKN